MRMVQGVYEDSGEVGVPDEFEVGVWLLYIEVRFL